MKKQISDLIQGRKDGTDILKGLQITDATEASEQVLTAIKTVIELVDDGNDLNEACTLVLSDNQQSNGSHPLDTLHRQAAESAQQVGAAIAQYDAQAKQGAVMAYQQLFNQELSAVLASGLVGQVADVEMGENWVELARKRKPLLTPPQQAKSLPSSSDSKSSKK